MYVLHLPTHNWSPVFKTHHQGTPVPSFPSIHTGSSTSWVFTHTCLFTRPILVGSTLIMVHLPPLHIYMEQSPHSITVIHTPSLPDHMPLPSLSQRLQAVWDCARHALPCPFPSSPPATHQHNHLAHPQHFPSFSTPTPSLSFRHFILSTTATFPSPYHYFIFSSTMIILPKTNMAFSPLPFLISRYCRRCERQQPPAHAHQFKGACAELL